ncbi:hypothetical protein Btru_028342 [Bulinus truncatus]|nr:hypothetical protein Btru_028342 [Bulinus truncatus]
MSTKSDYYLRDEVEEVEVYIKVKFRIQTWDGNIRLHEADLPGEVMIRDLKEELKDELGDPQFTDWYIDKNNTHMQDDNIIYGVYDLQHEDVIRVIVHNPNDITEVMPVMEQHR